MRPETAGKGFGEGLSREAVEGFPLVFTNWSCNRSKRAM